MSHPLSSFIFVALIDLVTSTSVDQATTSVETLTSLVQQVLQSNQDLCARLRSLELSSSDKKTPSTAQAVESDDEDDASTIRPKRHTSDPVLEANQIKETGIRKFTFEQDLRQSRVYKRIRRRNSLQSLSSSTAPSFGWSCLSEMSLANVSNISVISLPIAVNELTNGEHYGRAPIRQPLLVLDGAEFGEHYERALIRQPPLLDDADFDRLGVVGPVQHGKIAALNPYDRIAPKCIAILGKNL